MKKKLNRDKVQLKEIIAFAQLCGADINAVLDAWNESPTLARKQYTEAKRLSQSAEDATPGNPQDHTPERITWNPGDTFKYTKADAMEDDKIGLRRIMNSLKSNIKTRLEGENLWVLIKVSSKYSEHVEEEHLIFDGKEDEKSEGTQNAINSAVRDICFRFIECICEGK